MPSETGNSLKIRTNPPHDHLHLSIPSISTKGVIRTGRVESNDISQSPNQCLPNQCHEGAKVKQKRLLLRRGILAGAVVLAGGATTSLAVTPAGASNTQMSIVGSSTTFLVMHALFPQINDINPFPVAGSATQSIAPDPQTCVAGVTYSSGSQAPNGSGAGKRALAAEETATATAQGCIDFGRSSSPPAPVYRDSAERFNRGRRPGRVAPRLLRLCPFCGGPVGR